LNDRVYFLNIASTIMRRVLVNYAKWRRRKKRGEGKENIPLDSLDEKTLIGFEQNEIDVIALEEVLIELANHDAQAVKILNCIFTGG
jgi:hypothetical protein